MLESRRRKLKCNPPIQSRKSLPRCVLSRLFLRGCRAWLRAIQVLALLDRACTIPLGRCIGARQITPICGLQGYWDTQSGWRCSATMSGAPNCMENTWCGKCTTHAVQFRGTGPAHRSTRTGDLGGHSNPRRVTVMARWRTSIPVKISSLFAPVCLRCCARSSCSDVFLLGFARSGEPEERRSSAGPTGQTKTALFRGFPARSTRQ